MRNIPKFLFEHKDGLLLMSQESVKEVVENFSLFDDWEDRYRYLIDLGRELPKMDDTLKTDESLVRGCTSRVWLITKVKDDKFSFEADSDAHIVRGLVSILILAYKDCNINDVGEINIDKMFEDIGLDQHLSANRRSGFFAMVERIKSFANM